jgi:hypothetical protein
MLNSVSDFMGNQSATSRRARRELVGAKDDVIFDGVGSGRNGPGGLCRLQICMNPDILKILAKA